MSAFRTDFFTPSRSNALSRKAMVATSHALASEAGLEALRNGGNAMDAALTAVIVQGVVDPAMTGIGGDCFCLIGEGGGAIKAFNGSGRSAAAARNEDIQGQKISQGEGAAITVPGAIDAWWQLHQSYGKLPWAALFQRAIEFGQQGFIVHERVAADWAAAKGDLQAGTAASIYLDARGKAPQAGQTWRLPQLAKTLSHVSAPGGRDQFYQGAMAAQMVATAQAQGGNQALSDWAEHRGEWVTPISTSYGGAQIHQCPPNGQGLVALIAFAILDAAKAQGFATSSDIYDGDRVEWQLRALSAGYEARDAFIADPAASQGLVEAYLAPSHIAGLVAKIAAQCAAKAPLYQQPYTPPHRDTVYVAARDASGLSVSLINSIFNAFGSCHVAGDTGILLHSRGQSFAPDPAHPNAYGPSKRPMHTIIPALATRAGAVETVFAVMGAHYQPQGQVHVYTAMMDCGLSPQGAQDVPRWFANPEGFVEVEPTVPEALVAQLRERLGDVRVASEPLGGSQIIQVRDGLIIGGTDPRKDGLALGLS